MGSPTEVNMSWPGAKIWDQRAREQRSFEEQKMAFSLDHMAEQQRCFHKSFIHVETHAHHLVHALTERWPPTQYDSYRTPWRLGLWWVASCSRRLCQTPSPWTASTSGEVDSSTPHVPSGQMKTEVEQVCMLNKGPGLFGESK